MSRSLRALMADSSLRAGVMEMKLFSVAVLAILLRARLPWLRPGLAKDWPPGSRAPLDGLLRVELTDREDAEEEFRICWREAESDRDEPGPLAPGKGCDRPMADAE